MKTLQKIFYFMAIGYCIGVLLKLLVIIFGV
jgi:hypothetical protein